MLAFGVCVRDGAGAWLTALANSEHSFVSLCLVYGAWTFWHFTIDVWSWCMAKRAAPEPEPSPVGVVAKDDGSLDVPVDFESDELELLKAQARRALHQRIIDAAVERGEVVRV